VVPVAMAVLAYAIVRSLMRQKIVRVLVGFRLSGGWTWHACFGLGVPSALTGPGQENSFIFANDATMIEVLSEGRVPQQELSGDRRCRGNPKSPK
jgi:hypothetical protein